MDLNYDYDKQLLFSRPFGLGAKYGGTFDELYNLLTSPSYKDDHKFLYVLKNWNISPYTTWYNDFGRLAKVACTDVSAGCGIDRDMAALLYFVQDVPGETEQEAIAEREVLIRAGNYDPFVKNLEKFQIHLKYLREHDEFRADVKLLGEVIDLNDFAYNNVARRTLACERNIRHDQFYLRWKNKRRRGQHIFDAFCGKHELYGLELINGQWEPLLMKVTVNPTPHGIIIFIPKWMSFDLARDLVFREISKLIRARGIRTQGPKRTEGQIEREQLAREAYQAHLAAIELDKKGDERIEFVIDQLGLLPETDERNVRRLIKEGEALLNPSESRITIAEVMAKPHRPATDTDELTEALRVFHRLSPEQKAMFKARTA